MVGLAVHLENGQRVMFTEANALKRAQSPPPSTTLTAFFDLCTTDNFAKTLKYPELPEYYTWNKITKQCQRRKRGELVDGEYQGDDIRKLYAIRMYTVSPRAENATICVFYLMKYPAPLLFRISEQSVTTSTAHTGNLVWPENSWKMINISAFAMEEAAVTQSPANLRSFLAIILTTCMPSNPVNLWNLFKDQLSEDFLHQHRRSINNREASYNNEIYNQVLEHYFFQYSCTIYLIHSRYTLDHERSEQMLSGGPDIF